MGGTRARVSLIALCSLASLGLSGCADDTAGLRHYERGQQYFESGQLREAIIEFRNAVKRDEQWGEARYRLAEAHAANGEPEHAFRQYIRAADLMPANATVQLKAVTYLLMARRYDEAQARAERLLETDPENIDAHIALGNALAGLRDLDGAIDQMNEAIRLDPDRRHTYAHLARVRLAQGRATEARVAFERALQTSEPSVAAYLALANFHWSQGETQAAEESLHHALLIDPRHALTNRALAILFQATERRAEAERYLLTVADATGSHRARLELADYYMREARPDDARRLLAPLATSGAARAAAETRLASLAYADGGLSAGRPILEAVLAREPSHAPALALKARWLLLDGQPEAALEAAQAAVAADPQLVAAYQARAEAEVRTRRSRAAINSLVKLLHFNPHDHTAQIQLSHLHLLRNEFDSAALVAEQALASAPGSVDARLALLRALIARHDLTLADTELAVLKAQAPDSASVHAVDGALRLRRGDRRGAHTAFTRALRLDPSSKEALLSLTAIDVIQHNVDSARDRMAPYLAASPDDPELLLQAAKVAVAARDLHEAERWLRQAIAVDPLGVSHYGLLARVLTERGTLDAAAAVSGELAGREPSNLSAAIMAAILAHTQGRLDEATHRYEEILRREPRAALAANNLAAIYLDAGENLAYAQQLAERAVELFPGHAALRDTLGWIYYHRHVYGLAIRELEQSVLAEPSNPVYHYHLGMAYSKTGNDEHARAALRRALALNPQYSEAAQVLAAFEPTS